MSAPSVAVGTNPSIMKGPSSLVIDSNSNLNNRRRVVTEKRVSVETLTKEGFSDPINRVRIGNDVGHLIRGESVFERQRDLSRLRREITNSNPPLSPRRRKGAPRPGRPRWKRVISVLTKNLILLLVLFWLGQKIRHWVAKHDEVVLPSDFEGRISQVEAVLKATVRTMQAKVDAVDSKIESEVGRLRWEITERVEGKSAQVDTKLQELGHRTESLERALADLRVASLLTKEEFENFLDELKASREHDKGGEDELNLDGIRALAKEIVEREIEKHAADGLGRVDYALFSGGGRVIGHSELFVETTRSWLSVGKNRMRVYSSPDKMLEPSFGEPGQCFALRGSAGFVVIRLRTAIIPEAVTLEHVAKSVAYDRSSAPKDCQISGWFQGHAEDPTVVQVDKTFMLTEFVYDLEKSNVQTYDIEASDAGLINTVRLDFTSNHGNPQHTCIYRLRVHGHESDSLATFAI